MAKKYTMWSPYTYVLDNPILFIDPDGREAKKWPPDYEKIKQAGRHALKTTGAFLAGVGNSWASNQVGNAPGTRGDPSDWGGNANAAENGQMVGDALSVFTGTVEMVVGSVAAEAGIFAAPETFGASLVITGEGAALAAHGYVGASSGLQNLMAGDDHLQGGDRLPNERLTEAPSKRGNAPKGDDGKPVELHHRDQTPSGPIDEMTFTDHRGKGNYKKNHSNTGQIPSLIKRPVFGVQRTQHWRQEWDSGRFTNLPKPGG
jgi:hypothetical protein